MTEEIEHDYIGSYRMIDGYHGAGLFAVTENDKYGYVNADGEVIIPIELDAISYGFSSGDNPKAKVLVDDYYVIIRPDGYIIQCLIPTTKKPKFVDGKAQITLLGDTFYIDRSGRRIEE